MGDLMENRYKKFSEAIEAAKELSESMETNVKVTLESNGDYALFGNGVVMRVISIEHKNKTFNIGNP